MEKSFRYLDAYSEGVMRGSHPRLEGVPDHGLVLEPKDEAQFRDEAKAHNLDFDELKYRFELTHQVTDEQFVGETEHQQLLALLRRSIIPRNALTAYFRGYLRMAISSKNQKAS